MQLRSEVVDEVTVLAVSGPVESGEAASLQAAVQEAVAAEPRGVVLDLSSAGSLCPEAVDALNWMSTSAAGWPRPVLAVCCAPAPLRELLLPAVQVHEDRERALAHVDDRPENLHTCRTVVEHGPQGARQARALAAECAQAQGLPSDDLTLVVSELVTNAIRYGQPPVEVEIDTCEHCVTVVVADAAPQRPAAREAGEDAEGGRGLLLVDLLSRDHGVRPAPPGKAVWAQLPRT